MTTTKGRHPHRTAVRTLVILACWLVAGGLAPARAQSPPAERTPWWRTPEALERLGLTDSQRAEIEEIAWETGEEMIDLKAALEKARLRVYRLLDTDAVDEAEIERAVASLEVAQCAVSSLEARSRTRIALVLNRDQRARLLRRLIDTSGPQTSRERAPRRGPRPRPEPRP